MSEKVAGVRASARKTKGVPPARFAEMEASPEAPPISTETPSSPEMVVEIETPANATARADSPSIEVRALEREFDRKLVAVKNELSRQMHAMQSMLVANNKQLQITMSTLISTSQQSQIPPRPLSQIPPPLLPSSAQPSSQQTLQPPSQPQSQQMLQPPSQPQSQQTLQPPSQPQSQQTLQPLSQPPSQQTLQPLSQPPSQQTPGQPPLQPLSQPLSQQTLQTPGQPPLQPFSQPPSQPPLQAFIQPPSQSVPPLTQTAMTLPPPFLAVQRNEQQSQPGESPFLVSESSMRGAVARQRKIYPLPPFSGRPEQWPTFFEAFITTTAEFEYSNLHNIMRLREALNGAARDLVESMLASSNNVTAIIDILRESFGRPEQLIKCQVEKVREIPPLVDGNLIALVEFANRVSNMTTFLLGANGEHHLINPTLLSALVAKLPTTKQMEWAKECSQLKRVATVIDFSNWITNLRRLAYIVSDVLPSTSTAEPTNVRRGRVGNTNFPNGRQFACTSIVKSKCLICEGECKSIPVCKTFLQLSPEVRWERVKKIKLCFSCLKKGHRVAECNSRRRCEVGGCLKNHNPLLHSTIQYASQPKGEVSNKSQQQLVEGKKGSMLEIDHTSQRRWNCHIDLYQDNAVLFQVVPVKLFGQGKSISTYAFIDDGANVSIIDREIAKQLGLHGHKDTLQLQWLNDQFSCEETERVAFRISGIGENAPIYNMANVYTSSNLLLPKQSLSYGELLADDSNDHLIGLPLREYANVQPKLVLSLAHAHLTVPVRAPRIPNGNGPIAMQTRLGWVVYGPLHKKENEQKKRALHVYGTRTALEEMSEMMDSYFSGESFGIKSIDKPILSEDNEHALSILRATTKRVGERYEAGLLWKRDTPAFPKSYDMALKRLESIERKMEKSDEYAQHYRDKINDYLEKGYARELCAEEAARETRKTLYLPHFGVQNPNKPGLRIVFDAAAETQSISLNKALLSGPDINQPLLAILFKFRQAPVAVHGDIKEMFLQVLIRKEDQDSQRFLWRNGDASKPVRVYVMQRMIFGATCSPCIAQYIKNCNAERFIESCPRAVMGIVERHYVDDYVDSFQTEEEAVTIVKDVIKIHEAGGFQIRNFSSNSKMLGESLFETAGAQNVCVDGDGERERILGMQWVPKEDVFVFTLNFNKVDADVLSLKRKPTKREMLGLNMSVFDPFGLLVNFTVTAKLLMQMVWKSGIGWDDAVPESLYEPWKRWLKELPRLRELRVPRCYFLEFEQSSLELHIFVDASEEAMATVAYWRSSNVDEPNIAFACAKSSCAPLRFHSTPKLELQAAVMGLRLGETIAKYHTRPIVKRYFWTDSSTVIRWIRSDHRIYKPYVANRVAEILEHSGVGEWRWCPGVHNPADDATRARYRGRYDPGSRWINGPDFLRKGKSEWPKENLADQREDLSTAELRSKHRLMLTRQVCFIVPNVNRFSNYRRLKRTMGWVLRCLANLKSRVKKQAPLYGELTADEEIGAEKQLCRCMQWSAYRTEILSLQQGRMIDKDSPLISLNPFLAPDGLLRVNGRIDKAVCLPRETRQPIILPKDHRITKLLVDYYHRRFLHQNVSTVMSELRRRFWIPSLRRLVNTVQSDCCLCRLRRVTPRQPQMGMLPSDRVTPFVRPFSYTGVDFFGPVLVTIRRCKEKRWVALFTCLTVRAVHLEVAADLSSDACILCVRNFINRRGVPVMIRSDNGTNFVGIPKELQGCNDFLDHDKMTAGLAPLGVKWRFNTPSDASAGGAWERLVQSVKRSLYFTLKERAPKVDTFHSLLIEIENIVNSRPLTHLPVTPEEEEPLTPNHFLLGCANSTQTPAPVVPRFDFLRKQWKVLQNLKNCLWRRWIQEYLPELTRRTKWCLPSQSLSEGCLVLIVDGTLPRSQWRRGRVVRLIHGPDGVARSAEVATGSGVLKRPISKLAVLDVVHPTD